MKYASYNPYYHVVEPHALVLFVVHLWRMVTTSMIFEEGLAATLSEDRNETEIATKRKRRLTCMKPNYFISFSFQIHYVYNYFLIYSLCFRWPCRHHSPEFIKIRIFVHLCLFADVVLTDGKLSTIIRNISESTSPVF